MTNENKRLNIASEIEEADRCLLAADTLIAAQLHKDALNRLYHAGFHLACALLLTEGREVRTHRGVMALLSSEFVKTGRLPASVHHVIARLQTWREHADYDRGFVATPELVVDERAAAGWVRTQVVDWLGREGW